MEQSELRALFEHSKTLSVVFILLLTFSVAGYFPVPVKAADPVACDPSVQLLTNGDFETPVVTNPEKWDIFPDGSAGLGWQVSWVSDAVTTYSGQTGTSHTRPTPAVLELEQINHLGWLPSHGDQYAELDTDWQGPGFTPTLDAPASVKISQDIPTVPGNTYKLTFDFSPRPDTQGTAENILNISWDGAPIDTVTAQNTNGNTQTEWSAHSYTLTAASTTGRIEFADGGIPDSIGTFLDNISLTCATAAGGGEPGGGGNPGGDGTATSTATSTPAPTNDGGGGAPVQTAVVYSGRGFGGFVGNGGSVSLPPTPAIATTTTTNFSSTCPLLSAYLRYGANNDPSEVIKLQAFLQRSEGSDVNVNGVFDLKTLAGVNAFQTKYLTDVMGPWEATQPSGYVYITTKKKINQIACDSAFIISPSEQTIIDAYKASRSVRSSTTSAIVPNSASPAVSTTSTGSPDIGFQVSTTSTNKTENTASVINASSIFGGIWNFVKSLFGG